MSTILLRLFRTFLWNLSLDERNQQKTSIAFHLQLVKKNQKLPSREVRFGNDFSPFSHSHKLEDHCLFIIISTVTIFTEFIQYTIGNSLSANSLIYRFHLFEIRIKRINQNFSSRRYRVIGISNPHFLSPISKLNFQRFRCKEASLGVVCSFFWGLTSSMMKLLTA